MAETLTPIDDVQEQLRRAGYLADMATGTVVHLAKALSKPVLIEGPAGTGKTQLAKSVALMTGKPLIRLQCYEGLDESKAIYEWDYRRQLLQLQLQERGGAVGGDDLTAAGIFGEDFLLSRPLLAAIRSEQPVVLLIDEVDRLDMEAEALLLEVLSEYQVSIPELGTVTARHVPQVFLTSNNTRDLSEALKRRCLYLHLGYPSMEREAEIVQLHVPELGDHLASEIAALVAVLRGADLKKPPVDLRDRRLGADPARARRRGADRRDDQADPVGPAEVRARHHPRARRAVPGLNLLTVDMPATPESTLTALVDELRTIGVPRLGGRAPRRGSRAGVGPAGRYRGRAVDPAMCPGQAGRARRGVQPAFRPSFCGNGDFSAGAVRRPVRRRASRRAPRGHRVRRPGRPAAACR